MKQKYAALMIAVAITATIAAMLSGLENLATSWIGMVVAAAIALAVGVVSFIFYRQEIRRPVQERPSLSLDEIFEQNYSKSDVDLPTFKLHWGAIAKALGEDPGRLRPSDRFAMELRERGSLDYSNDDLVVYAQKALGNQKNLSQIRTLNDLMLLLCGKRQR